MTRNNGEYTHQQIGIFSINGVLDFIYSHLTTKHKMKLTK